MSDFKNLSAQPFEKLFEYVTEKESSTRRHIAEFLIERHLRELEHEKELTRLRAANEEMRPRIDREERRANFALILAAFAIASDLFPFLWGLLST